MRAGLSRDGELRVGVARAADIAASPSKPRQTLVCPSPRTISTQAIVQRVKVANFAQFAFPEQVHAFLANVASAWARRAESELLRQSSTNACAAARTGPAATRPRATSPRGRVYLGFVSPRRGEPEVHEPSD